MAHAAVSGELGKSNFRYQAGDLVSWDNLTTMHRGGDFDLFNEMRDMRRTIVCEGTAPAVADDPFTENFAASMPKS